MMGTKTLKQIRAELQAKLPEGVDLDEWLHRRRPAARRYSERVKKMTPVEIEAALKRSLAELEESLTGGKRDHLEHATGSGRERKKKGRKQVSRRKIVAKK